MSTAIWPLRFDAAPLVGSGLEPPSLAVSGMRPWSLFAGAPEPMSTTALAASSGLAAGLASGFPASRPELAASVIAAAGKAPASAVRVCSRELADADD